VNLAPWRYRNVLQQFGGPIESLTIRPIVLPSRKSSFQATARLIDGLVDHRRANQIYGHVDGTGTAPTKTQAMYKAISESLER
jgi:hypothetical protein